MREITIELTDQDIENVDLLRETLGVKSNSDVISMSLALATFLGDALRVPNTQILLKNPDGSMDRVTMPELETGAR